MAIDEIIEGLFWNINPKELSLSDLLETASQLADNALLNWQDRQTFYYEMVRFYKAKYEQEVGTWPE